ncbi:MAG TPA: DNA repair protein RecO [Candidatus Paceibacterota bacterium]|jgi:DNA repair protein RecO|nr:DNA repair protein RecO [Parcubacteria group bacterium]MDP6119595.1 DNA repair protein RecO [Candidatus Paceibacterota bacterium]HJN62840.1 DNA repair protein RecO [Candidatus Paceibacterota bacterium]|tara:strand:+ start:14166 stop:14759 length:594 start_codon:yes stop_codon:yes gene_type:complete
MSYTKYKTAGIVIGGANIGEASRNYNIFTRDFGLIRVRAQGVRELKSKLKYNLQNLFLINLYLIKGKNGWHITEAYKIKNLPDSFRNNKIKLQSSTRVLLFLKRVLGEEDSNRELFDIITKGFDFMESGAHDDKSVSDLETLIVLRTLRSLGYVQDNHELEALLAGADYNSDMLSYTNNFRPLIVKEINQSIKASDL